MQLEDGSPEVVSGHIIRMFDECLENNYSEAKKALQMAAMQQKKDSRTTMLLVQEGKDATAAFQEGAVGEAVAERGWSPFTGKWSNALRNL